MLSNRKRTGAWSDLRRGGAPYLLMYLWNHWSEGSSSDSYQVLRETRPMGAKFVSNNGVFEGVALIAVVPEAWGVCGSANGVSGHINVF
jgi:hypothetical protein